VLMHTPFTFVALASACGAHRKHTAYLAAAPAASILPALHPTSPVAATCCKPSLPVSLWTITPPPPPPPPPTHTHTTHTPTHTPTLRADRIVNTIGGFAAALGRAAGCDPWAVEIFAEEVVRGGPAFAISLVISGVEPRLRQLAELGAWQVRVWCMYVRVSGGAGGGAVIAHQGMQRDEQQAGVYVCVTGGGVHRLCDQPQVPYTQTLNTLRVC
jgi:hypothetical protein